MSLHEHEGLAAPGQTNGGITPPPSREVTPADPRCAARARTWCRCGAFTWLLLETLWVALLWCTFTLFGIMIMYRHWVVVKARHLRGEIGYAFFDNESLADADPFDIVIFLAFWIPSGLATLVLPGWPTYVWGIRLLGLLVAFAHAAYDEARQFYRRSRRAYRERREAARDRHPLRRDEEEGTDDDDDDGYGSGAYRRARAPSRSAELAHKP